MILGCDTGKEIKRKKNTTSKAGIVKIKLEIFCKRMEPNPVLNSPFVSNPTLPTRL